MVETTINPHDQPGAPSPAELRDVGEVLSVEADDERGDEEDGGDDCESLHHIVLVIRDRRLVVIANAGDEIARELEPVREDVIATRFELWPRVVLVSGRGE
jgi:hypothetical protein